MLEETWFEGLSVSIQEAVIFAITEDIHLNAGLFAKIVVDADLVHQTVLQWHQVYTVPAGCQLREVDGLSPIEIGCKLTTLWNIRSDYLRLAYGDLQLSSSLQVQVQDI